MTDWETDDAPTAARDPRSEALFAAGVGVVAANSALYFFGVESLSHPTISVLGVALLAALYVEQR